MKKTLLSLSILLTGFMGFAQYEGFENWTTNSVLTLDDYQSPANEMGAFGNLPIQQSTDAVDGTYSVKLETVIIPGGDTAFGYFLSGDPDLFTPGQPVTLNNVDSITGYYKYDIMAGDSVTFLPVTFFGGIPTGPASGEPFYIKGSQATWKRFAYYIGASFADSLLMAVATGDPLNNFNGIPGTWIMFDNIQLKSSIGTTQNILNHSFENWTPMNWEEPNGIMTSNQWAVGEPTLPAVKSTDMYSGNFALELNTIVNGNNDTIQGIATNGNFGQNGAFGGVPYTSQPNAVNFYYKYAPSGVDTAWASIQFKSGGSVITQGGTQLNATGTYTLSSNLLSIPSAPDTMLYVFYSGNNPGSQLLVDHVDFTFPVGINENIKVDRIVSYPNPTTDVLNIKFELKNNNIVTANLIDITGKVLTSKSFGNLTSGVYTESFNTSSFGAGVYFIEFIIGNEKLVNRFLIK